MKTLKDFIEIDKSFETDDWFTSRNELIKELKQAAIEWIKWYNSALPEAKRNGYRGERMSSFHMGATLNKDTIGWIKHFFNISEEDLQ